MDSPSTIPAYITSILRWIGTALSAYLVQHGLVSGDATWIAGAVLGAGTLVWSLIQKKQTATRLAAAQASQSKVAAAPAVPK